MKQIAFFRITFLLLICVFLAVPLFTVNASAACSHPVEYMDVIEAAAATCTTVGHTEGAQCLLCGDVIVSPVEIPKLEHTPEEFAESPATCTKDGNEAGTKCSVCKKILSGGETIYATGHTEAEIPGKDATCTESGLTVGKECSVCGETLLAQQETPALGHTEEVLPATVGDCQTPGLTEGKVCAVCGEVLVAQQSTGVSDHVMVDGVCTVCGYKKPASSTVGLDNVPKTGDITNQVVFTVMSVVTVLAFSVFAFVRKFYKW